MKIRAATYADAEAGAQVLQRSITELCRADHNDNDTVLAAWTANKTPRNWKIWIDQNETELFVAVESDQIAGVGMLDHAGTIMLNYVSPDHRWRGVSKALLAHMERQAVDWGLRECVVESTKTARRFYESEGYQTSSEGIRMTKTVAV